MAAMTPSTAFPQYGRDQSKGPVNYQAAYRVYAEGALR